MRFSIRELEDGLQVRYALPDGSVEYIEDDRELHRVIASFISEGYVVKRYSSSVVLCSHNMSLRIENYSDTIQNPLLRKLRDDISVTVKRDGYVDKTATNGVSRKPNRAKSKGYSGFVVKAGVVALLLAGIVVYAFNTVTKEEIANAEVHPQMTTSVEESVFKSAEVTYSFLSDVKFDSEVVESSNLEDVELPKMSEVPEVTFVPEVIEPITVEDVDEGVLPIADEYNTDKAILARNLYSDLMEKFAYDFGLDAELLLAMATEERGVHEAVKDPGGGYGLMQIQYDVWVGHTIDCYRLNHETGQFEPYSIEVTEAKLATVEGNIEVACAIQQTYMLREAHYNIPVGIQMYNQGPSAVRYIISQYCEATGKDYDTVMNDPEDLGWVEYCHLKPGDPKYLAKVNKWVENRQYSITNPKTGEVYQYRFTNGAIKM